MIEDGNINHLSYFGSSNHEVLLWNVICHLEVTGANSERKKWQYLNTIIPAMNEYFTDINWENDSIDYQQCE